MGKKINTFTLKLKEDIDENVTVVTLSLLNELLNVFICTQDKEKLISKIRSIEELEKVCRYLNLNSPDVTKSILDKYGV